MNRRAFLASAAAALLARPTTAALTGPVQPITISLGWDPASPDGSVMAWVVESGGRVWRQASRFSPVWSDLSPDDHAEIETMAQRIRAAYARQETP